MLERPADWSSADELGAFQLNQLFGVVADVGEILVELARHFGRARGAFGEDREDRRPHRMVHRFDAVLRCFLTLGFG